MAKRKHIVLPIEGASGKYVVENLKDNSLVLIAQSIQIFKTHTDILQAFEKAQQKSPETGIQQYEKYYELGLLGKKPIRERKNLVQALEDFSKMSEPKDNESLVGGGRYRLAKGIFTFSGRSDTYWGVNKEVLRRFIPSLKKFYEEQEKPLRDVVIK